MVRDTLNTPIIGIEDPVLVTGAGGFIGPSVVRKLLEYGFRDIRCIVRSAQSLAKLETVASPYTNNARLGLIKGDLLSRDDCVRATNGVRVVYHLAAGTEKSFAGAFMNSALATRNLMSAFLEVAKPRRFVNISSFAVYSNLKLKRGAFLDETCELEEQPQERFDAYCFGKLKQEEVVRQYGIERGLPYVIVRPGTVFGPGKQELTGRIGINTFGFFIHLGGSNQLPLTFVDNCADAIVLAGLVPGVDGETFNIVDDELMTSKQFLAAYTNAVGPFFSIRVPYPLAYGLSWAWEKYSKWSKGQLPPVFNRRRCSAEWKGNRYSNRKLRERLGWQPKVSMERSIGAFLSQFESSRGQRLNH